MERWIDTHSFARTKVVWMKKKATKVATTAFSIIEQIIE